MSKSIISSFERNFIVFEKMNGQRNARNTLKGKRKN